MPQSNHITHEDILEQLNSLKSQLELLQKQSLNVAAASSRDNGAKFLLREFNELGHFWRHTDARMESALNLYLTASSLVVAGLVYLSQQVTDLRIFISLMILVAAGLFIGGLILVSRIVSTAALKAEYIHALNLIRRYFVDTNNPIKDYLVLPLADSPKGAGHRSTQSRPIWVPASLTRAINAWNGILFGFVIGAVIWLTEQGVSLPIIIGVGGIAAGLCFLALMRLTQKRTRRANEAH